MCAFLIYISTLNYYLSLGMLIEIIFFMIFVKKNKKLLTLSRIIDLKNRSPIYTFFSTTLGGIIPLKIFSKIMLIIRKEVPTIFGFFLELMPILFSM